MFFFWRGQGDSMRPQWQARSPVGNEILKCQRIPVGGRATRGRVSLFLSPPALCNRKK